MATFTAVYEDEFAPTVNDTTLTVELDGDLAPTKTFEKDAVYEADLAPDKTNFTKTAVIEPDIRFSLRPEGFFFGPIKIRLDMDGITV